MIAQVRMDDNTPYSISFVITVTAAKTISGMMKFKGLLFLLSAASSPEVIIRGSQLRIGPQSGIIPDTISRHTNMEIQGKKRYGIDAI